MGPNNLKQMIGPLMGPIILVGTVLGSSMLGIVSNYVTAEGPYLKNAWRFQALALILVFMAPFWYLYDKHFLRIERYRSYLKHL